MNMREKLKIKINFCTKKVIEIIEKNLDFV